MRHPAIKAPTGRAIADDDRQAFVRVLSRHLIAVGDDLDVCNYGDAAEGIAAALAGLKP